MHLKNNTRRIETPGHIVPIQELQEVPLSNLGQIAAVTSPVQTTIHRITTPAIHQEVIPEETADRSSYGSSSTTRSSSGGSGPVQRTNSGSRR